MTTENSAESGEVVDFESNCMSPVTPRSYANDPAFDGQKNDDVNETQIGNSALVSTSPLCCINKRIRLTIYCFPQSARRTLAE